MNPEDAYVLARQHAIRRTRAGATVKEAVASAAETYSLSEIGSARLAHELADTDRLAEAETTQHAGDTMLAAMAGLVDPAVFEAEMAQASADLAGKPFPRLSDERRMVTSLREAEAHALKAQAHGCGWDL